MTLLEQYMADYQRVCAEKVALQEQNEILDKQRLKWERLAMDRGFALEGAQEQLEAQRLHLAVVFDEKLVTEVAFSELKEQLETLRDVLTEAVEQLAIENEKRPNHNITLVLQRIALLVPSAPAGVTAPPDVDQGTAVAPRASGAEPDWQDMAETSTPASSPTYHVPEEHGRFPAVGMTAPDPATQRGHTEYRSNLLGETTAGASSPAKERAAATDTPFEKPRMQQIGESLPVRECP